MIEASIVADFSMDDIVNAINSEVEDWIDNLIASYSTAAKKFVDGIRKKTKGTPTDKSTWGNITWNLRSSIGYILLHDGQVVEEYFPSVGGGDEGSKTGADYAREIATLVNEGDGIQLVVVAGMEYAVFVEGNGIDVLSHASKGFPKELRKEFKL